MRSVYLATKFNSVLSWSEPKGDSLLDLLRVVVVPHLVLDDVVSLEQLRQLVLQSAREGMLDALPIWVLTFDDFIIRCIVCTAFSLEPIKPNTEQEAILYTFLTRVPCVINEQAFLQQDYCNVYLLVEFFRVFGGSSSSRVVNLLLFPSEYTLRRLVLLACCKGHTSDFEMCLEYKFRHLLTDAVSKQCPLHEYSWYYSLFCETLANFESGNLLFFYLGDKRYDLVSLQLEQKHRLCLLENNLKVATSATRSLFLEQYAKYPWSIITRDTLK